MRRWIIVMLTILVLIVGIGFATYSNLQVREFCEVENRGEYYNFDSCIIYEDGSYYNYMIRNQGNSYILVRGGG